MQEKWVWSLRQEDALDKEMETHFNTLNGKSHRWRTLAGYSTWGRKESDTTEHTHKRTRTIINKKGWLGNAKLSGSEKELQLKVNLRINQPWYSLQFVGNANYQVYHKIFRTCMFIRSPTVYLNFENLKDQESKLIWEMQQNFSND